MVDFPFFVSIMEYPNLCFWVGHFSKGRNLMAIADFSVDLTKNQDGSNVENCEGLLKGEVGFRVMSAVFPEINSYLGEALEVLGASERIKGVPMLATRKNRTALILVLSVTSDEEEQKEQLRVFEAVVRT